MNVNLKSLVARLNDVTRNALEGAAGLCLSRTNYDVEVEHILAKILEQDDTDLHKIAAVWNHGSVVRSWLNELAERAFEKDIELSALRGYVEDSGEGRWTVQEAIDLDVPAPVITLSLLTRLRSRQTDSFSAKVIAALRNEFGGHAVKKT